MIPAMFLGRPTAEPPMWAEPVDPLTARYLTWFAAIDWTLVPERDASRPWPGPRPHPRSAALKALLIKTAERLPSAVRLRTFLLDHRALTRCLGFRPVANPHAPDGIDWPRTVPSARWFRQQAQHLDQAVLDGALRATVAAAQAIDPTLGAVVAIDTTVIYARVRENNPNRHGRLCRPAMRPPRGDHDCRYGCKVLSPRGGGKREKTFLYGYTCGFAATTLRVQDRRHDVALATTLTTVNRQDITTFPALYEQTVTNLGHQPTHLTADAAFDAWYVYEACLATGGIAAIAANPRSPAPPRSPEGHPRCAAGLVMRPVGQRRHEDGYPVQCYACPLTGPTAPPGVTCSHPAFATGGCQKRINIAPGGVIRAGLDRTTLAYRTLYAQRTCVERINSQAKSFHLDHPRVRTAAAVQRHASLTAIAINLNALQRAVSSPHVVGP